MDSDSMVEMGWRSDLLSYNKKGGKRLNLNHQFTRYLLSSSSFLSFIHTQTHRLCLTSDGIAPKANRVVCTVQLSVRGE